MKSYEEHARSQSYEDLKLLSTEILTRLLTRHGGSRDGFAVRLVGAIEQELVRRIDGMGVSNV